MSSDALEGCAYVQAEAIVERDGRLLEEDGGFAVQDDRAPELVAPRFVVSSDAGGSGVRYEKSDPIYSFDGREMCFDVDYARDYGFDPALLPAASRCGKGNERCFALEFDHEACELKVTVRIRLVDRPTNEEKRDTWRDTIEHSWSGRVKLVRTRGGAPCAEYLVRIVVEWVTENQHYEVHVGFGDRPRANMTHWYLGHDDIVVAHEFGHMLGNIDEYDGTGDGCPDRPIRDGIMNDKDRWHHPFPRHFWLVRQSADIALCSEFDIVDLEINEGGVAGGGGFAAWALPDDLFDLDR